MQQFDTGKYLGVNTFEHRSDGLIFLQTHYGENFLSEWHYHENPLLAFTLKGGSVECRKQGKVESFPGMLVLYNTQEGHKNEKYRNGTRNFIIEFEDVWFRQMQIDKRDFEGNFVIENQEIKDLFLKTILEVKERNTETGLAAETLIANIFANLLNFKKDYGSAPKWLCELKNLLHDAPSANFSLKQLSEIFNVHPVTISKLFPRFFGINIGDYIRKIKIENSLELLSHKHLSLEVIAQTCGFTDHAHFSKIFKKHKGIAPSRYRQIIFG